MNFSELITHFWPISIYVKTRYLVFTSKIFEKHLWQSDICKVKMQVDDQLLGFY